MWVVVVVDEAGGVVVVQVEIVRRPWVEQVIRESHECHGLALFLLCLIRPTHVARAWR